MKHSLDQKLFLSQSWKSDNYQFDRAPKMILHFGGTNKIFAHSTVYVLFCFTLLLGEFCCAGQTYSKPDIFQSPLLFTNTKINIEILFVY